MSAQRVTSDFPLSVPFKWSTEQKGTTITIRGNSFLANNAAIVEASQDSGVPFENPNAIQGFIGAPNALSGKPALDMLINLVAGRISDGQGQNLVLKIEPSQEKKSYTVYLAATRGNAFQHVTDAPFANGLDVANNILGLVGLDFKHGTKEKAQLEEARMLVQGLINTLTSELFLSAVSSIDLSDGLTSTDGNGAVAALQQLFVFVRQNSTVIAKVYGIEQPDYIEILAKRAGKKALVNAVTRPADVVYAVLHASFLGLAYAQESAGQYKSSSFTFEPPVTGTFALEQGLPPQEPTCANPDFVPVRTYLLSATAAAPDVQNVSIKSLKVQLNGGEIGLVNGQKEQAHFQTTQELKPGDYTLTAETASVTADGVDLQTTKSTTFTVPKPVPPQGCDDEPEPEPDPIPDPNNDYGRADSMGDPHLYNYENTAFDFQGTGEFILTRSTIPGDTFEVQVRQLPMGYGLGGGLPMRAQATKVPTYVTVNRAVALQVGPDRVTVTGPVSGGGGGSQLTTLNLGSVVPGNAVIRVNGLPLTLSEGVAGGRLRLAGGGYITTDSGGIDVHWKDGSVVHISTLWGEMWGVSVTTTTARRSRLVGLLGNFDGQRDNDFALRDGTIIAPNAPVEDFYGRFGEDWRVRSTETLFDYEPGQNTESFTDKAYPEQVFRPVMLEPAKREWAETICEGGSVAASSLDTPQNIVSPTVFEKCVIDVALTGMPELALGAAKEADRNLPGLWVPAELPEMTPGQELTLSARVSGQNSAQDVSWTATGGTVTRVSGTTATYRAPSTPGTYTITSRSGLLERITVVEVKGAAPQPGSGPIDIKLNWKGRLNDLDLHLWFPKETPYHLYYGRSGHLKQCPHAQLNIDALGILWRQEKVTINKLVGQGQYQVLVNDFPLLGGKANFTGAQVVLNGAQGQPVTVQAPGSNPSKFRWWHVATIDAQTGAVQVVNRFVSGYQPYNDTGAGCKGSTSGLGALALPTDRLASEQSAPKPLWTPDAPNDDR